MFLQLVHLHSSALRIAVSTSFCHFSFPESLVLGTETAQHSPATLLKLIEHLFPMLFPPLTNVHQDSYIIPKLAQMN